MGGMSLGHWLIVLVIVVVIFGTKRLKNVGKDLGEGVRGFKEGMSGDDKPAQLPDANRDANVQSGDRSRQEDQTPR